MDVYFEKIAGVAETTPEQKPEPAKLDLAEGAHDSQRDLDEHGFPVTPMDDQDGLWFVQASRLHRPLARAAGVASFSGGMMLFSGILTLLLAVLTLVTGAGDEGIIPLVIGMIITALGWMERSSGVALAALEPKAPKRLALNQLTLFGLVALGCVMQMKDGVASAMSAEETAQLPPEVLAQLEALGPLVSMGVFGVMIALSLVFQGGLALYYLTRKRHIAILQQELPPWVTDVVAVLNRR